MMRCPIAEHAEIAPHSIAAVQGDSHLSYLQLHRWISAVTKRLARRIASPLAFSSSGELGEIILLFAALRSGRAITPLNHRFPEQAIECCLKRLGIERLSSTPHTLEEGSYSEERLRGELRLFTSGSSGQPKIAALSPRALLASAEGAREALQLDQSCWRLSLPLFHVGGIATLFRCFQAGAMVEIPSEQKSRSTHISFVPTQLYRTLKLGQQPWLELRCLLLGGAPASEALILEAARHGWPVHYSYGMTEMSSLITMGASDQPRLGRVLPQRELSIAADGEILVRGATLFSGYLEGDSLQLPLQDGWFATRDLGELDEEGHLIWKGRKDAMFTSFGENVQPEEIERELLSLLPMGSEVVVIPLPDAELGARPIACIHTEEPFVWERVRDALSLSLPKFKIPASCLAIPSELRGGKLSRPALTAYARKALSPE